MRYTIRHFDLPLLTFEANMDSADTGLHIIKVYKENRSFLPLNTDKPDFARQNFFLHQKHLIEGCRHYLLQVLSVIKLAMNKKPLYTFLRIVLTTLALSPLILTISRHPSFFTKLRGIIRNLKL